MDPFLGTYFLPFCKIKWATKDLFHNTTNVAGSWSLVDCILFWKRIKNKHLIHIWKVLSWVGKIVHSEFFTKGCFPLNIKHRPESTLLGVNAIMSLTTSWIIGCFINSYQRQFLKPLQFAIVNLKFHWIEILGEICSVLLFAWKSRLWNLIW